MIGVAALFVVFTIIDANGWYSFSTLGSIIHFAAMLGLIAMGEAFVIMGKEIDLSVGSVYGLAGITFITLQPTLGVPGSIAAGLLAAAAVGFIQAFCVLWGRLPSMIVTLGGLFAVRGLIYLWTGGTVTSLSDAARAHWMTRLFGGDAFGIKAGIIWALIAFVILSVVLWRTRFGNQLLATGGDINTAISQGVQTNATKRAAFVLCSVLAGFAGILTLTDEPQTHVTLGESMELEAIAAAVIGGSVLTGGRGSLIGALLGAFIITSVRYELIRLGAPASWYISFVGVVLIVGITFNQSLARWAGRSGS